MKINAFLMPNFKIDDEYFTNSICIYIDVLRASTTICAAIFNGAKEIIPIADTEQAMKIYSILDRDIRLIGGEKNMHKPGNFDLGNSPAEYTTEVIKDKTIIFTTTNGTNLFQLANNAKYRIISAFVNFNATLGFVNKILELEPDIAEINFFCAGNDTLFSYEDTLCAGNLIFEIMRMKNFELNDSAHAAKVLYEFNKIDLFNFIKSRDHSQRMLKFGLDSDIDLCLRYDTFPIVPVIEGLSIKKSRI